MINDEDSRILGEFIKRMPIFKNLSDRHLSMLMDNFSTVNFKKGDVIFYQSDDSTDLYIVFKGKVRASLLNEDGEEFMLGLFKEGDFFGEMSLLDGMPRSATMIAMDDSSLGVLKRDRFLMAVKNEPMIAIDLLSALVQRMRTTDEIVGSLAFLDVSQRLVKLFMNIALSEGERDRDGFYRIKKLTHKELASRTGASREAVSKSMKMLSFRNAVTEKDGFFIISPDAEKI